ncbi:hypothetical protein K443DRAFT_674915 [Laccaria amethystina LaAM-08-1]|uniref:F-box domain-containing protein n=1 Tax=Laccaria amethystina LaAM-08-1 TaxID=1095629 RepID=A0A0C9XVK0_9AGAR|nr:hypothetical protein K443DRAFT_674915 [Laccaria amethystina LaAM-08-1]
MDFQQVPSEVYATIFEVGVLAWGIEFLPRICLVCRAWNEIVITTPSLWGIISIHDKRARTLGLQITKAKDAPLTVSIPPSVLPPAVAREVGRLTSLSHNWVSAEVHTNTLLQCRWLNMRSSLGSLQLSRSFPSTGPTTDFFGDLTEFRQPPKLHTFTATALSKEWILPFLSSSIEFFRLRVNPRDEDQVHLSSTINYLSHIPAVKTLIIESIRHSQTMLLNQKTVYLRELLTLELARTCYVSPLLCAISATSLQTLIVDQQHGYRPYWWNSQNKSLPWTLAPFFLQWSHPNYLPANLHTLKLIECLQLADVAFLIRFLARLPNLVRLIIVDDAVGDAAELPSDAEEMNLFGALESPKGAESGGGWLCPSLMVLHLETDLQVQDLIRIARARNETTSSPSSTSNPNRLRWVDAMLCSSGSRSEVEELRTLVDSAVCHCLDCLLNRTCV